MQSPMRPGQYPVGIRWTILPAISSALLSTRARSSRVAASVSAMLHLPLAPSVSADKADAVDRPEDGFGAADDPVALERAPVVAVVAIVAVVAHHEVLVGRHLVGAHCVAGDLGDVGLVLPLAVHSDMAAVYRQLVPLHQDQLRVAVDQ